MSGSRQIRSRSAAAIARAISVWGLLVLLVLLIVVFSLLKPDTFLTYFNISSILTNKSVQALVALAVFIPMTANQFDLSAGFNLGICAGAGDRAARRRGCPGGRRSSPCCCWARWSGCSMACWSRG